jgi:hypothetical protein
MVLQSTELNRELQKLKPEFETFRLQARHCNSKAWHCAAEATVIVANHCIAASMYSHANMQYASMHHASTVK